MKESEKLRGKKAEKKASSFYFFYLKHKRCFFFLIVFLIVLADQLTKFLVLWFSPRLTKAFFSIHLVKNTGAAFGLLKGQTFLLSLFSLLVVFLVIYYYRKISQQTTPFLLTAFFLGGVLGNLIDRLFRGFVVDFIDFSFWPAFNLADLTVTLAAAGLIFWSLNGERRRKKREN